MVYTIQEGMYGQEKVFQVMGFMLMDWMIQMPCFPNARNLVTHNIENTTIRHFQDSS